MNQQEILQKAQKQIKRVAVHISRDTRWDFPNWLVKHVRIKKGSRKSTYSFKGYEPYLTITHDLHKYHENWFLKGTQIGFSTIMIGWSLYCPYWKGLDTGYCLPDKVMIKPFMKTRFSEEQIEQNPELREIYEMHESDMYYSTGDNFLYFIGANVLSEGMSRPMEIVNLDEVTIISTSQIEMMEDRLGAASFGQLNGFAMEIYPQGPTEKGFEAGRQNVMVFKCPHCGHDDQILEEIFYHSSMQGEQIPPCVKKTGGTWHIVCVKCGRQYDRSAAGRWVARHPDRDINSYRVPQLIFEGLSLDRIMRRWIKSHGKKSARAHLHSTVCAIPDAGDLQGIQKEHIIAAKSDYQMRRTANWSVGGCDVGNYCHVVFGDVVNNRIRVLWWEVVDSDDLVERLSMLIIKMNCRKFVIDYKPHTSSVRKLAARFPKIVVLHEYREGGLVETEKEHAGKEYDFVSEEREEALDDYDDLFTGDPPMIMLPLVEHSPEGAKDIEDSLFAKHHYKGSQKVEEEDRRLGKKIYKHVRGVENHYYHAGNYMKTALKLLTKDAAQFIGLMPQFGKLMQ